ncbi:PepSY domain-containing protein [Nitrospirillum sp. BR 11828]|uniref:PepSY domain-containing protein n=1 Tax=Nitrospirillum sp. BR 11828 TaxID=3104325 RepID=UPI002ACA0D44|nr:PepSY domain-containing protein [Nitrospirillum sp. BR 11828]MDZ5649835.1 PepSY domain-containing protein [Nitrospirillum sp. BR 11828]
MAAKRAWGAWTLRQLAWFHRWAGILLCLMFAVWFASGAVMVFVPFPALSDGARRAASPPIDMGALTVPPAAALAGAPDATGLRLINRAGRPTYVVTVPGRGDRLVVADDGPEAGPLSPGQAALVASRFAGAAVERVEGPFTIDQWVVHQHFASGRPYYRVVLADGAGTWLYVSALTGEVAQRATRSERLWNWCGAVLHWVYVTPLRQDWGLWNQVVWWLSFSAVLTTMAGLWLGIQRTVKARRGRRPRYTPFPGWLGWHHLTGLVAGTFVATWIISGWLSMDHGRLFSTGEAPADRVAVMRGTSLAMAVAALSPADLRLLAPAAEVDFNAIAGQGVAVAYGASAPRVLLAGGQPMAALPPDFLTRAVRAAWPDAVERSAPGPDDFYLSAEGLPPGTRRFGTQAPARADIYVDALTGRVGAVMDDSRKAYAWLYYALHTFTVPGLASRPALRATVQLTLLSLGMVFSVTGIVVGVRRLRRSLA